MIEIYFLESLVLSTILYLYLHKKTRISTKYLFIDNVGVIILSTLLLLLIEQILPENLSWLLFLACPAFVLGIAFSFTMIRFWRTPKRKSRAGKNEIISPADGNILYITKLETNEIPVSIKKGIQATLSEVTQTDLLKTPCWLIGINMTPFDVHKNCAPVEGKIILNKHIKGEFRSLKDANAIAKNERNTLVIQNEDLIIGIVQTASKLVRRIDSYVQEGTIIKRGEWFGMIRFGSQVDVILPQEYKPEVTVGQQIYAAQSIIAKK